MKLSIITINLNDQNGLRQTIESVVSQTFNDYEFIIIDGGSKDGSIDVIKEYESRISKWISEPDKGIYNAMNKGIKIASGEYLHFLNAGDRLASKDVLEIMFLSNPQTSFICGNFWIEDSDKKLTSDTHYKDIDWTHSLYEIYSKDLCHQAFFIKADNFSKYGLYDETLRITSDWKLFFEAIAINKESVLYVDKHVVIYNMEGISSSIGGTVIKQERSLTTSQLLSQSTINQLDTLSSLEQNAYIIQFVQSKKWIYYAFHAVRRLCIILGISKDKSC